MLTRSTKTRWLQENGLRVHINAMMIGVTRVRVNADILSEGFYVDTAIRGVKSYRDRSHCHMGSDISDIQMHRIKTSWRA
jgi:hypothetical protein